MSQFEKFVTEGNEEADVLANAGAMLDEGFMAEAKTMQQEKEEVYAALQYAASFHCLVDTGRTVKSSSQSRERSGFLWIRKGRRRSLKM